MASYNELWFAARMTKIVYMPPKLLETFGETRVRYHVVSAVAGDDAHVKIRCGEVASERPRIITPHLFIHQLLDNFGTEARQYFENVLKSSDTMRILQYGLCLRKEEHSEELVGGVAEEVAEEIGRDAQDNLDDVHGVLVAPDAFWEVSLLYFLNELIRRSLPYNASQMKHRGLLDLKDGVPEGIRQEVEQAFATSRTREDADHLGNMLREYGLFDDYEEQFFELYGRLR